MPKLHKIDSPTYDIPLTKAVARGDYRAKCCNCGRVVHANRAIFGTPAQGAFLNPEEYCSECAIKLQVTPHMSIQPKGK